MKLIFIFLMCIVTLNATPSGYLVIRDTFFGQNEEKYSVIRYTFENKGSYYEFHEYAEFREYLLKDNRLVKNSEIYTQTLLTNGITEDGEDKLTKVVNQKFDLMSKFSEYTVSHRVAQNVLEGKLNLTSDKGSVLFRGSVSLLDFNSEGVKFNGETFTEFELFEVNNQFYLKMIYPVDADGMEDNGERIVAVSEEANQRLRWIDNKASVYLALSFHKDKAQALKWIEDTKQENYQVWKVENASEKEYAIILLDGEDVVKQNKISEKEKLLDSKLTLISPDNMLYRVYE